MPIKIRVYTNVAFRACGDRTSARAPEREIDIIAYNEDTKFYAIRLSGNRFKQVYFLYDWEIIIRDEIGRYYQIKPTFTAIRF